MFLKKMVRSPQFFVVISLIILFLGYSQNFWRATDYVKYYDNYYSFLRNYDIPEFQNFSEIYSTFDRFSESFVIGRIVKSKKDGLLSSGGFVGRFYDIPKPPADVNDQFFSHAYQYKIYFDEALTDKVRSYGTIYKSQSGGQAFVLSLLDRIVPGEGSFKIKFYYRLMALLTTLAIFLIIFWFYKEFGVLTGWLLVFCFALFSYPTLYAKSLWWVLWAFYVPFLFILYVLRKEDISNGKLSYQLIFLLSFLGMFIKIFLNGFEFITTTVIMATIPAFYYALKNKWELSKLFYRLVAIGGGIALSVLISIVLLSIQFVLAGENFVDGLNHVYNSFLSRAHGTGAYTNWLVEESAKTPIYEVLKYYFWFSPVFDFHRMGLNFQINIEYLLLLFLGISILWLILARKLKCRERFRKINALNATLWISSLAPLSWFIIFKGHSCIHKQHDPIVWFMPFMFYGIGMLGITIEKCLKIIINLRKR
jgi:hypothetical protein